MGKRYLLLLALLCSLYTSAQRNLSGSRQSSLYTYIYAVSPSEAEALYRSTMHKLKEKYLHALIDSFITKEEELPALKPGNYLFVAAIQNKLSAELKTIGDLQFKLLENNRDLLIALHDKQGQLVRDAQVYTGNKRVPYNNDIQAFCLDKKRKASLIKVYYQGAAHFYPLRKQNSQFWRKLSYSFPLKYVVQPVRRLFQGRDQYGRRDDYFSGTTPYESSYKGFMVFSKPQYKPGDTVKLKAWVATKKSKPVNRPLLLRLTDNSFLTDTILTTVHPYRPGGYEYNFVTNDTLDLDLDEKYLLTLEEESSRKYDVNEYEGDLDEDEYALKRKVLMRGKFEYEEYELNATTFTARSDKKEHNRGDAVAVYCKASDDNGLGVMDGRVELRVMTNAYGNKNFHAQKLFLPDTLWKHSQMLESLGETKILIPDSIFPAVSFSYDIVCTFLNSNNEYKTVTLNQQYDDAKHYLRFDQQKDSLHIDLLEAGKSISATAIVRAFGARKDTSWQKPVTLPAHIRIDPFIKYYEVQADSLEEEYTPTSAGSMLVCNSLRTHDSVTVQVVNPHHIPFWYNIFAGNKVIQRGYADSLFWTEKVRTPKNYFVSLQYIYGNTARKENYTIAYKNKQLNVQVQQPEQVYPGQQVTVGISVTSDRGEPVADADVTAYAFTRKFKNAGMPDIPYFGKWYKPRKRYNSFSALGVSLPAGSVALNWARWSKEMQLDSIEYYRFLHTPGIYTNTEPARDSITQIAPFVTKEGSLYPVHMLYIDEVPYFFSQAQHLQQYSFAVKPGKHALKIRTAGMLVQVDSIWAAKGVKTFIGINVDAPRNGISVQKMSDVLTAAEKNLWNKYMILVENNFDDRMATIQQDDRWMILNLADNRLTRSSPLLVGPLRPTDAQMGVKSRFRLPFDPEGGYQYLFSEGLIKQKQLSFRQYAFDNWLSIVSPRNDFKDFVLTAPTVDSLWQDYLDHKYASEDLFHNKALNREGNGELRIGNPLDTAGNRMFIKSVFLFRYDDPDFARIYQGNTRNMGYVQPGLYRMLLLLKDNYYIMKDSLLVKPGGVNYYAIEKTIPVKKDSTSLRLDSVLNNRETSWNSTSRAEDMDAIKLTFNNRYFEVSPFSRLIIGNVSDKVNFPLPGALVKIKGTNIGTVTDSKGNFQLRVPDKGAIVIDYIGYNSIERRLTEESYYEIKMTASEMRLQEVVVVGYGTTLNRLSLGKASFFGGNNLMALQGSVPGVMIRGASSLDSRTSPLYIIDGVPVMGDWNNNINADSIANITVLKEADAISIYGSRAANGAVIITTKRGGAAKTTIMEEPLNTPGNTLRRNFRDDAFWQPKLRTDQQGKVSFTTIFPDDITNWRTFVIAMGNNKQTGFAENSIRSFKALSAAMAVPQFAVAGDSIQVIGKTMNYGTDTVMVKRSFSFGDKLLQESTLSLRNTHIDSFNVVAGTSDSVKFKYTIQKADGYFDGEERSIPVFKQGVQETKGFFTVLDNDSAFNVAVDPALGNITVHAEASVLPALLEEIDNLDKYEYLCNEQLASKLKALLLKKKVYSYLHKEFKEGRKIDDLLGKLSQNRSGANLWGWWKGNDPSIWISLHVTEAMLLADEQGFRSGLNKQSMIDYLVYNFNQSTTTEQIAGLNLLQLLAAKVNYQSYFETLDKSVLHGSLYEKLHVLELKQKANLPVSLDTFLTKQHRTMMGNSYWGEDSYHFFNNSVQNTLTMYHLLKRAGNHEEELKRIRYYFLEKRRDGKWRNTYESTLILETILPDLFDKETAKPAAFSIAGSQSTNIRTFPYSATFPVNEKLTIIGQRGMPVYFTAYQQGWNPTPKKVAGDFTVNTSFEVNGQTKDILKAGEPVTLKVQVTVKADADYVMVEIPIPAGCSYKDKQQGYGNNEVHREHFKNKVSIFCRSLAKGNYTFTVSLLPRYNGRYHLNPAKAEMMYFPVFYGREEMKEIRIN